MSRIHALLEEYGESHQHPLNKLIHWVCVPLIVWSLLALLWSIKTPTVFTLLPLVLNWAILLLLFAMVYYLSVSRVLAVGALMTFILMLLPIYLLDQAGIALWRLAIAIFVVAWIGQFIGHTIEGKRPSFFKDVQFLLIGPLWLLSYIYQKLGIKY